MFIASFLCTLLMNDAKRINFVWGKQKSVKKKFLQSIIFFNGGSSVLPLTTTSFKKTFSSKNLSIEIVFEIQVSITLIIFCAPLILCYKLFKSFFRKKSFLWKESSAKKEFSFLSSELCTPTHNNVKIFF